MSNAIIMKANIIRERAVIMGKFDYKFVEVPCDGNLKNGNTETLERCKEIIMNEAAQGWRLIQIISPAGERRMISGGCYRNCYWKRKTEVGFPFFVLMRLYLPLLPIFYNLLIYD